MRQVHQIVDHQHVVRADFIMAKAEMVIVGHIMEREINNQACIRGYGVAHPYPYCLLSLNDRESPYVKAGTHLAAGVLRRHVQILST